ncbi:hypothetical protein A3F27_03200 [Candidatus Kaiserbacteria bacterium RIFCSPHIGHO2_12_FULL_53_13]|uniref:tRNA N6-adenosine threonylcarbamoyltransferase n=1 Tax=Candidatus Kaiserbacteria bacterium RIFCSPHIGHO2_12_FULL_53_13 TaxID=1798502 RepID=A0A1F6E796_9BACT|nr:MAG: hypothetical protein A3F27_03200 [Candidatus Kaiserbacteria bacterium RIFCSPHIGHO2_12_FULL_53_13]OGG74260.1 MAG: hypothetical protein A3A37_01150 [Candidatus Kaiserbacteria bacterium RIFCSPLOWO2_01_FULL_52_36]
MRVLGIETSCDETAVSLIEASGDFGADFKFRILGNALFSQTITHAEYGGVVPNLAKREHGKNLVPLLEQVLNESGIRAGKHTDISVYSDDLRDMLAREPELYAQLSEFLRKHEKPEIDCIAVTVGPGLEPALWVGINFARALSEVWDLPVVAVNHMEGHVVMSLMEIRPIGNHSSILQNTRIDGMLSKNIEFPALALLISGGHTELVLMREWMKYEVIGTTRDDAVGEAFDKVARLLGLPYPGGPHISRLAEDARKKNIKANFSLPRPMLHEDNLDFSFSGLKTAVLRIVESNSPLSEEMKSMIAREFEDTVADVLVEKTLRAVDAYGARTVIVGGGVSANSHIRAQLASQLSTVNCKPLTPPIELATDNALMIALAGYFRAISGDYSDPDTLRADGNLKLA